MKSRLVDFMTGKNSNKGVIMDDDIGNKKEEFIEQEEVKVIPEFSISKKIQEIKNLDEQCTNVLIELKELEKKRYNKSFGFILNQLRNIPKSSTEICIMVYGINFAEHQREEIDVILTNAMNYGYISIVNADVNSLNIKYKTTEKWSNRL